ncbi:M48 family metallopeptidase [Paeniglutamicibacter antarcticus]|uniref:M48 family metallopeptidase n=1 Tax=Paeniglutamicibacter antarcticus TaxID=494023 RepID=A0ABP9TNB3_9MICC
MNVRTEPSTIEYLDAEGTPVRVVRSARRKKTISGAWKQDTMVVSVPAGLTEAAERMLVDDMVKKVKRKVDRGTGVDADAQLLARAHEMDVQLFARRANPVSVRWVSNQNTRWGSASLASRRIRLSEKLRSMPQWVQDYVLAHELAHLVEPRDGHGPRFKAALDRYPRVNDAKIFLAGASHGFHAAERAATQPGLAEQSMGDDEDFDDFGDYDEFPGLWDKGTGSQGQLFG